MTKNTYSELSKEAEIYSYTTKTANLDPSKESSMGKLVTKILTKSNEKIRATVYETLVTAKGESHINNSKKWENNYNIKIDNKTIKNSIKTTMKMKVEPRIKERMLWHMNQTLMKINSLYKLNIKKNKHCKECKEKIEDWEHVLYSCQIAKQTWEITQLHLDNTYNTNLSENITKYFLPLPEELNKTKINEEDKIDAATLIH